MPCIEYLEDPFEHFPHHLTHQIASQALPTYSDTQQNMHHYNATQQSSPIVNMPTSTTKTNETKPRLGKDEVDILEREFKKNPKPTTQTKRQFAEDMEVDLARINNWFQNRRAKRKQERKQEAFEAGKAQEPIVYSEPSSPEYFGSAAYFSDNHLLPMQQPTASCQLMSGPPPAVASYNPQYPDPSSASMESLQRTMAAAQAGSQHQDFHGDFIDHNVVMAGFGGPLSIHNASSLDRAQFPPANSGPLFDDNAAFAFGSAFGNTPYNTASQAMVELHLSASAPSTEAATSLNNYPISSSEDSNSANPMTTFPSQLLPYQSQDGLPRLSHDSSESQSPEDSNAAALAIGFNYDFTESSDSSQSPPAPSAPFKSPPPPTDIASRRKKVHVKPAALVADTLRGRPLAGPRTISQAEGFRRQGDNLSSSPMRRIVSAGGNRNVLSGRIQKSSVESAQRSPINLHGFADSGSFREQSYQNVRHATSLTAGSSLNSSLLPLTPISPDERERMIAKLENARSTASPVDSGLNFVFNAGVPGCFTSMERDQNMASPPETPGPHLLIQHPSNGWSIGAERQEKAWNFEVPDKPLYTPAQESFQLELQMPQPSYLSSLSQPVTPAFGNFTQGYLYEQDSPQFTISNQGQSDYWFAEGHMHYPSGVLMTSPSMTKQKTFQFSNTTAADFSEK